MELREVLSKFGFSDKEISVFSALLELGTSVVSDLAKKADINRSTTYVILESLDKQGVIKVTENRGIKVFSPLPHEKIAEHFATKAKLYSQLTKNLGEALSQYKPKKTTETNEQSAYEDALVSLEAIRTMSIKEKREAILENPALAEELAKTFGHHSKQAQKKPLYGI